MSENVQIVTAVLACLTVLIQSLTAIIMYWMKVQAGKAATAAAEATETVKSDLNTTHEAQKTALADVAAKVEEVRVQTNGLTAALVKSTGDASFAAGQESQRLHPGAPGTFRPGAPHP